MPLTACRQVALNKLSHKTRPLLLGSLYMASNAVLLYLFITGLPEKMSTDTTTATYVSSIFIVPIRQIMSRLCHVFCFTKLPLYHKAAIVSQSCYCHCHYCGHGSAIVDSSCMASHTTNKHVFSHMHPNK